MPANVWSDAEWRAYKRGVTAGGGDERALALVERDAGATALSGINDPSTPLYNALVNLGEGITFGGPSIADLPAVTTDTAVRITAVYRAMNLIAGVGNLPKRVLERTAKGREQVLAPEDAWIWGRPNPEVTPSVFWKTWMAHNAGAGNSYVYIVRDGLGRMVEAWNIHPKRVRVGRDPQTKRKVYILDGDWDLPFVDVGHQYLDDAGKVAQGEISHVMNLSLDGLTGINPIAADRLALQIEMAAQQHGARTFANGATPLGILTTEADLSDPQAEKLMRRWEKMHRGIRNAGKISVLDNNAKYQAISLSMEDLQYLDVRKFGVQEIARIFGVPPHLLADSSGSTSWGSGLEEQTRAMIQFTFSDYTNRAEEVVSLDWLPNPQRYFRFDYRSLLRGNTLQRFQSYHMAIMAGWLSRNEAREWEDLDARDGLDEFLQATNMATVPDSGDTTALNADLQSQIDSLKADLEKLAAGA